ncbi:hypothetical protein PIB30_004514 [Stylosanthes scabra]|uniref:Ubiquitin-like protease family profile domain-containing protein n=1 Tax=Stylosanthes scabra TaxID=79078 RepID=A0ABU6X150_9FABA|nr:hypothetical protein [Stylosanthes scabra]
MAKKDVLKRKNPTMRVPPSKRNSDSESESYQPSSYSEATESNLAADTKPEHDSEPEPEAEHDAHDEPPPQREIRSKWKNDRPVVGSNETMNITQQSVAGPRTFLPDNTRLVELLGKRKRRTSQQITSMSKKQKLSQINEGDEAIPSPSDTRMFNSFDTVSLGRDDSDNIIVEGPVAVPSQPDLQPGHDHETRNDDQPEHDLHEKVNDAGVDVEGAAIEAPHVMEDNVQEDEQPEPLIVIMPLEHEDQSKIATKGPSEHTEPEKQIGKHTEVEPNPLNMEIPFEPELTLQPWLQPEVEATAAKDTTQSADEMITTVLLSMNKEEQDQDNKQNPQPEYQKQEQDRNQQIQQPKAQEDQDQCKTPDIAPASIEERCYMWAIMPRNDNKYETIFQLRGPNTMEAMRYNLMTMAPETCIDMTTASVVCHILNREPLERFQRDVYCVPLEILIRMFDTYGTSYINKKTKMPYLVSNLKDQRFMELLDKEKLKRNSCLFAPVLYSRHWWLYVLDVNNREFYIADSMFGADTSDRERSKLYRFAPNPTGCGIYVMKWMEVLDSASLSSAYAFKTQCPIEEWDQDQLNEFRKEIVSKVLMSEHNTLNIEAISQATNMTQEAITEARKRMPRWTKPSAALRSPFLQPSTAELENKH